MKNLIVLFKVFKEGRTSDWVTILIPRKDYSERILQQKKELYISLGYKIKSI